MNSETRKIIDDATRNFAEKIKEISQRIYVPEAERFHHLCFAYCSTVLDLVHQVSDVSLKELTDLNELFLAEKNRYFTNLKKKSGM